MFASAHELLIDDLRGIVAIRLDMYTLLHDGIRPAEIRTYPSVAMIVLDDLPCSEVLAHPVLARHGVSSGGPMAHDWLRARRLRI